MATNWGDQLGMLRTMIDTELAIKDNIIRERDQRIAQLERTQISMPPSGPVDLDAMHERGRHLNTQFGQIKKQCRSFSSGDISGLIQITVNMYRWLINLQQHGQLNAAD